MIYNTYKGWRVQCDICGHYFIKRYVFSFIAKLVLRQHEASACEWIGDGKTVY